MALLVSLPTRAKAELDGVSPKHTSSPSLGSMGMVPGVWTSSVEITEKSPAPQAQLALPTMGGPGIPPTMQADSSPALALTSS